jgi:hypothetical protein
MTSAAERFFTTITNQVLEATEQINRHVEENLSVMFGGTSSAADSILPPDASIHTEDMTDDQMNDESMLLRDNPLQDMAQNVVQGILDQQVRTYGIGTSYCRCRPLEFRW